MYANNTMSNPRVLLVCHGKHHDKADPGYKFLHKHPGYCYTTGTYVDWDTTCKPTHVMDVTENQVDFFEQEFDYIFIMYAPSNVLKSRQFWWNVMGWLAPGGIVQTVIPRKITRKVKDWMFGQKICRRTGGKLRLLDKETHMSKRGSAIVLQKD